MTRAYDPYAEDVATDPRPVYDRMLAEGPVHPVAGLDAWAVVGFDAVWEVCRDTVHYTCTRGQTPNQVLLGEPTGHTFPELDPPEHRRRRRLLAAAYTRDAAARDEPWIRELAREVLAARLADGPTVIDAYADYAAPVTTRVAARKVGLPEAHAGWLRARMDDMFRRDPGQRGSSPENLEAIGDVFAFLMGEVARARRDPDAATGVLADLVTTELDGVPLSDEQIAAELHTLVLTGSETTELAVAAALVAWEADPRCLDAVRADRSLVPAAFAEAIRLDHPTNVLCRAVVEDVDLAGTRLHAGDGVLLVWAAANRDPTVVDRPTEYDLHRRPARDLLFGHGQHKCLGEHLAMTMGTVLLEEFLDGVAGYRIDHAGVERIHGEFLKGVCRLPMHVVPRT